jgi:AraC-like DNA-binding protein
MDFILIIGVFQAMLMAALVISKKNKSLSDYFLTLLFLVQGLTIFLSFMEFYNRSHNYPYPAFISTSPPLIFLHGPLLWFYIKALTSQRFSFRPVYLLHFLPFTLVALAMSFSIFLLPAAQKIEIDRNVTFQNDWLYPAVLAGVALFTQGYFIWGLLLLKRYRKKIKGYFSKLEDVDLRWLRFFLFLSVGIYAFNSLMYIFDYAFDLLPYGAMQLTAFVVASVFILVLGFYGVRQGSVFVTRQVQLDLEKASEEAFSSEKLETGEEQFIRRLLDFMKDEKPFLDPELTIARLADLLGTGPERLSSILNKRLNKNFFDFVNHYRVEEFKNLAQDPANSKLSIMGVAWDSGFNSKATFNRVFKQLTGITPGQYRQQVSK